ncbi:MAG: hypothetical protein ACK4KT_02580 [Thermaurantimonas sp.]
MQWRQGDVLIELTNENTNEMDKQEDFLLVRGEGRYHGHFATGDVSVFSNGDDIYLSVHSEAKIEHLHTETKEFTGEHHPITLSRGTYRVIRQREYNPYEKKITLVQD